MADTGLFNMIYNPDVLTCLANLSNDEVFTPPEVANQMLDLLPQELFRNPDTRFLDPACKSGVFLREIAKRLLAGLERQIPDLQERVDHIFHHQLYGIAITELTSLLSRRSVYCSKYANSRYSVTFFETPDGNIRFKRMQHTWQNGKCLYCGATQSEYDRSEDLETYAYEFIHWVKPEEIFGMKFDVIISNPPYQLSDGGNGKSAKPLYHVFVAQAKKLRPRYLTMVIPSRWFAGGKGLDEFRRDMLTDRRISKLVDYENFKDIFPGVDLAGGACYFLWDREYNGMCEVVNYSKDKQSSSFRYLDAYETFIRQNTAVAIVEKIRSQFSVFLDGRVSTRKPFGIPSNYIPCSSGVPCHFIQRIGLKYANKADVYDAKGYLNKWKLLIPAAPIAGQTDFTKPVGFFYEGNTRIAKPGECCTESWLVAGAFDTQEEAESFKSYIFTKVARFLLLQMVVSQHISTKTFCFVPDLQKYTGTYTDAELCSEWGISSEEWNYIDSRISSIGGDD